MKAVYLGMALILFLSCSKRDLRLFSPSTFFPEEKNTTASAGLTNDTPENVLKNLLDSYNQRNFKLYSDLISPDFRFYMSPSFVGAINANEVSPPDPAYWTAETRTDTAGTSTTWYYKNYDQEMESIRRMFDPTGIAKDIELFFQAFPEDLSRPDTAVYDLRYIDLTITLRSPVMTVEARDGTNPEPTRLTLVKGKDNLWRIAIWEDNTLGSEDAL